MKKVMQRALLSVHVEFGKKLGFVTAVSRVSTEFRRHGIPAVFFYFRLFRIPCGIGCNSAGIPPNSVTHNFVKFRGISRNSVTFFMYGIPYISKETHKKLGKSSVGKP
jgi:hypothetical protein